jgi:hypothetical protein
MILPKRDEILHVMMEQVGTYPLPESQMDRFLIRTGIGYPTETVEKAIIKGGSIRDEIKNMPVLVSLEDILAAQKFVKEGIYLSDKQVIVPRTFLLPARKNRDTLLCVGFAFQLFSPIASADIYLRWMFRF